MNHGSLFSGIGGFDLAAQWMGWNNVFHCEINPFGQKVLKYYWPNAISYDDITKTDFTIHRGNIDILTGGFPCQPFSVAGKRKGTEDARNLWPEYHRAIREIQPTWVVGENVPGLINWSDWMVFEQVQADLEAEGYEVWPVILPACAVNAPHKRDRVWFIAYCNNGNREKVGLQAGREINLDGIEGKRITPNATSNGLHDQPTKKNNANRQNNIESGSHRIGSIERFSNEWPTPNTESQQSERMRFEQRELSEKEQGKFRGTRSKVGNRHPSDPDIKRQQECDNAGQPKNTGRINWEFSSLENWSNFPTQSPVCYGDDGLPARLDGITFPKWRNESIKAAGNAIVPQVVFQIFKAIEQFNLNINQ